MKLHQLLLMTTLSAVPFPCFAADTYPEPEGNQVRLTDVPSRVLAVARKALEAKPTAARTRTFEGQPAYEIDGTNKYDKHLIVVLGADGKILRPVSIWQADDD